MLRQPPQQAVVGHGPLVLNEGVEPVAGNMRVNTASVKPRRTLNHLLLTVVRIMALYAWVAILRKHRCCAQG